MARVHVQYFLTCLYVVMILVDINASSVAQSPISDEEAYPFVLNLANIKTNKIICGATLITPTCALTTAHCITLSNIDDLQITHEASGEKLTRKIERTIIPEKFEGLLLNEHDFAVIVLDKPYAHEEARTVVINFNPVKDNDLIKVIDWNRTQARFEKKDGRVAPHKECTKKLPELTTSFLCAPIDVDVGSSGRTIVNVAGQQVGMASFATKNNELQESSLFSIRLSNPASLTFLNETILSNCNGRNNL